LWSKRSPAAHGRNTESEKIVETIDDPRQLIDEIRISSAANTAHGESTTVPDAPLHEPRRTTQRVVDFAKGEPKPKRLVPRGYVAGLELNDWTGFQMTTDDEPAAAAHPPAATAKQKKRLKLLEDIEASDLAQMLAGESAQVVAVVFSHLDSRQAADVLKELPPALRLEVVRRLSNLDQMTDEVVKEIEDGLQSRLADQIHRTRRRNAGIRAVSNILDAASGDLKNDILGQLRREDVALSRKLQGDSHPPEKQPLEKQPTITPRRREPSKTERATPEPVITFEDVIHLDDDTLRTVLGAADPQVAILALAGATNEVVDRLIQSMKPQEAERLRGALTNLGPTRLRDVEASQKSLVDVASSLDADGRINLRAKRPLRLSA
jgi:flagellar motor switch protein FliG